MQSLSRGWSFMQQAWQMAFKDKDLIKPPSMPSSRFYRFDHRDHPAYRGSVFVGGSSSLVGQIAMVVVGAS